jgi:hypothetical protein
MTVTIDSMKTLPKKSRLRRTKNKRVAPRNTQQYLNKPPRFQNLWDRVVSVVSKIRSQSTSLQQTSREMLVSPRTVLRYGGSALKKSANGRYQAKKSDRLLRMLMVPSHEGPREIAVRDSRQASTLGRYWGAVHRYLATGDRSGIKKFDGKHVIDAESNRVPLLTDFRELDRLGSAGIMTFESIYGRTA